MREMLIDICLIDNNRDPNGRRCRSGRLAMDDVFYRTKRRRLHVNKFDIIQTCI